MRASRCAGALTDSAVSSTTASASRAFMWLSLALENRDLQRYLTALANRDDSGGGADARVRDQLNEVRRIHDGLAVEGDNDVARLEACLISRRSPVDLVDV